MRLKIIVIAILFASVAWGQQITGKASYTATDTSEWVSVDPMERLTAVFVAQDSVNVSIRIDYRPAMTAETVFRSFNLVADSTNSTADAGYFFSLPIRRATLDSLPGATKARSIVTKKTTKNGTTTPYYWIWFERRNN